MENITSIKTIDLNFTIYEKERNYNDNFNEEVAWAVEVQNLISNLFINMDTMGYKITHRPVVYDGKNISFKPDTFKFVDTANGDEYSIDFTFNLIYNTTDTTEDKRWNRITAVIDGVCMYTGENPIRHRLATLPMSISRYQMLYNKLPRGYVQTDEGIKCRDRLVDDNGKFISQKEVN